MNVNELKWREIRRVTFDVVFGAFLFAALALAITFDGASVSAFKYSNLAILMLAIVFSALFAFSRCFFRHLVELHK